MEHLDMTEIYIQNELLYYSNNKELSKENITQFINDISYLERKFLMKMLEQHKSWKEYDYYINLKLLQTSVDDFNVEIVLVHVLHSLTMNIKEIVILSMEILKHIAEDVPLEMFIKMYFALQQNNVPDMSFYGYLLPTIKLIYGNEGLIILQKYSKNNLYKLHTICKLSERNTLSSFIISEINENSNFSIYEDTELKMMLFEAICKRRAKVLPYETPEINFILSSLGGIDPPAINYFKYFVSHLCVTSNRGHSISEVFQKIQEKCFLLLAECDTLKVKRGAKIYADFYNCVVKSQYKTMYTLMECDKFPERKSPTYLLLKSRDTLKFCDFDSMENLKFVVSLINETNFHLFDDIFGLHDFSTVLTKEKVLMFYNNLQDDYLEDKIDILVKLLMTSWYKDDNSRKEYVTELFKGFQNIKHGIVKENLDYNLYRLLKMLTGLVGDVSNEEEDQLEEVLMKIVDFIVGGGVLKDVNVKLFERIIVASLDLLLKLPQNNRNLSENKLHMILIFLEKGIFCNKRYAASASGFLYRKFIKTQYSTNKALLDKYLQDVLKNNDCYNQKTSNMRRCLEKRILIHEFCLALSGKDQRELAKMICSYITTQELVVTNSKLLHEEETKEKDLKVYIFCVNALMGDASLKQVTSEFVSPLMMFCLFGVDFYSKDFAICNAIYTLYSTLVQRILPYHDSMKNMTLHSLLQLEPQIFEQFKKILTGTEHKRSSILLFLLLQRTNNETLFYLPSGTIQEVIDQLWGYFSCENLRNLCGFEIDSAIKLWVNLIPFKDVGKQVEIVQNLGLNTQQSENVSLNLLNVKFKLLEGLTRKLSFLNKQNLIKTSLEQNILCKNDGKQRIYLPRRLPSFPLKELTIRQSLRKILLKHTTIYEKITAFEFFFDYFQEKNQLQIFINRFLMLYIKTLIFECYTKGKSLEMFAISLNTIAFCLDCCNIKKLTQFKHETLFIDVLSETIDKKSSLLAFLTIFGTKIGVLTKNTYETCKIQQNLIESYHKIAECVDKLDQTEVESLLIAFKYVKYFKTENTCGNQQETLKIELFLIAMKFLHSIILSECDYLVSHVIDALNIDYFNNYLTTTQVRRFLLTKKFMDCYFKCEKSKICACLRYIHWVNVRNM